MTDSGTAIIAGLSTLANALGFMDQKLDIVVDAVTAEPEPSKIGPLLEQLVAAVNANTAALARIEAQTKPKGNGAAHG